MPRSTANSPSQLPSDLRELLRDRSKTLLGNRDRLEVAVAIASDPAGVVNAADLSNQLGMANNRVRANLLAFGDVGALEELPRSESQGRRWFRRLPTPFWDMCFELYALWVTDLGPGTPESPEGH